MINKTHPVKLFDAHLTKTPNHFLAENSVLAQQSKGLQGIARAGGQGAKVKRDVLASQIVHTAK